MNVSLFGVGDAGYRITNRLVEESKSSSSGYHIENSLIINTTEEVVEEMSEIPSDRHLLVGETHPDVHEHVPSEIESGFEHSPNEPSQSGGTTDPQDMTWSPGVGGDVDLAAEVAQENLPEIRRALDQVDETQANASMVIAGLGGGTGAGVGSVLVEELVAICEHPVYVLGVLPAATEPPSHARTAARALKTLVPIADSVFLVDNEAWRGEANAIVDRYDAINDMIASRITPIFSTGTKSSSIPSEVGIDSADVKRTLFVGGVTTIGQATFTLSSPEPGWIAKVKQLFRQRDFRQDEAVDASNIKHLVARAIDSTLTLPCERTSADRALLKISGPSNTISRKGFEISQQLLEDKSDTVEVLAGNTAKRDSSEITATVVLSNVTVSRPITALQNRARTTGDDE